MMKFCKIFAIIVLSLVMCVDDTALGRGRSGGGGFRSSSSRSSSWGSSSRKSTPTKSIWGGSSRKSTSTKSTWGGTSSNKTTSSSTKAAPSRSASKGTPTRSKADSALYNKAKSGGNAYTSKSSATSAFKTKNAGKYSSKYASKPTTRPNHIPATTSSGGNTYNINYNSQHGGYGYMGPSGSWMAYSMMSDAIMMDTMMHRSNYYYDRPGSVTYADGGRGFGFLGFIGIVFILIIFVGAIVSFNSNSRSF